MKKLFFTKRADVRVRSRGTTVTYYPDRAYNVPQEHLEQIEKQGAARPAKDGENVVNANAKGGSK